jgi:putative transposase
VNDADPGPTNGVCPTGARAAQQARNLAMDLGDRLGALRFLIHDRDPVFTTAFGEVFRSEGLRIIPTLPRTPRMNAICEHVIGTLRRELLDATGRTSPGNSSPQTSRQPVRDAADLRSVRRKRVVAGVVNEYHHAA